MRPQSAGKEQRNTSKQEKCRLLVLHGFQAAACPCTRPLSTLLLPLLLPLLPNTNCSNPEVAPIHSNLAKLYSALECRELHALQGFARVDVLLAVGCAVKAAVLTKQLR